MRMFHGVMAALEFLVLSVPVRIGVEQLPLPLSLVTPSTNQTRLFSPKQCLYDTAFFVYVPIEAIFLQFIILPLSVTF